MIDNIAAGKPCHAGNRAILSGLLPAGRSATVSLSFRTFIPGLFVMSTIRIATAADIPQIVAVLNQAYRGDASRKGWTTEADLIAGEVRADAQGVGEVLALPGSVFLVYDGAGGIQGCVNLQKHADRLYLGMFAVDPDTQGQGIGKALLQAADAHARAVGCQSIYMTVISVRKELIDWYCRHGYADTGERKPFPEDGRTGQHLQPLEFAVLEKQLKA
jgi:ribosomal protein S18 acetylase RimI-like enzyme